RRPRTTPSRPGRARVPVPPAAPPAPRAVARSPRGRRRSAWRRTWAYRNSSSLPSRALDEGVGPPGALRDLLHRRLRRTVHERQAVDRDPLAAPVQPRDLLGHGWVEEAVGHEVDRIGAWLHGKYRLEGAVGHGPSLRLDLLDPLDRPALALVGS